MKGIIFDFNGTMFQDSHLHEKAWIEMIQQYSTNKVSEQEILLNIHGHTNDQILRYFISAELTNTEIQKLSDEKEQYYRELCLQDSTQLVLTSGLEAVLDMFKEKNIPRTIATATGRENLLFYFETFDLAKWFDLENVVYDDGTFEGKPEPDIFLKAAEKIDLLPETCVVIEDAVSGILAADRAKIGKIIAIDPSGKNRLLFQKENLRIDALIENFDGFPMGLF